MNRNFAATSQSGTRTPLVGPATYVYLCAWIVLRESPAGTKSASDHNIVDCAYTTQTEQTLTSMDSPALCQDAQAILVHHEYDPREPDRPEIWQQWEYEEVDVPVLR
eukprot:gb/GECG01013537.1/.p1 GENE.gb/GECG01013537.1/~~gb/GECG01013537.1/.p1  ORF type:complete len:107 (+),score=5.97 gb/GECG01013537.1/:1-321(+)